MITETQIRAITDPYLEGTIFFVAEVFIRTGNRISVYLDGDQRVTVETCIRVSRYLESMLDRGSEDYDLTVSSFGADRSLIMPRQYLKNIGSGMQIVTHSGDKLSGTLLHADDHEIHLEVVIPGKTKRDKEMAIVHLSFNDIKTAKELITFKK